MIDHKWGKWDEGGDYWSRHQQRQCEWCGTYEFIRDMLGFSTGTLFSKEGKATRKDPGCVMSV